MTTMAKLRALVGARVSVLQGPEKVSHIAQLETASKWAEANGYEIVGQFEDLGVSASVRPDDRPDLGPWLTDEGAAKWDAIVWAKMDRAFRSTRHCVDFAQWAEEHHKVVVFAEDGLKLDYRPDATKGIDAMMAELFVYLGSFFAQLELNRFKTRTADSHRVLRGTDRWANGCPPLGFKVVDHPSGKGKGLDTEEEGNTLLYEMAERLLDGWSLTRIAAWLNESGALTNKDRARIAKGQPPQANPWTVRTVTKVLTSPATQGIKMHKQAAVLDSEGEPRRLGPATFSDDYWNRIQDSISLRRGSRTVPTMTVNPILGVGFCKCGASLNQQISRRNGKTWRYYRCGRTPTKCEGVAARADDVDFQLAHEFSYHRGGEPMTRRVFVPGEDHANELAKTNQTIGSLRQDRALGLFSSPDDEEKFRQQMAALISKRDRLEATPSREAGWETVETGQTKLEAWKAADETGRRQLYLDAGLRYVLARKGERSYFDRSHSPS
jgi:site-specific DNA recombinase